MKKNQSPECQRIFAKRSRLPRWRRPSGGISRRSSAGTLLVGWTQPNNRRHIDAGSRKPARCLRPESDAPDVFQSLKWFNIEDPDGNQELVVQAHFRVKQQMQKTTA